MIAVLAADSSLGAVGMVPELVVVPQFDLAEI